MSKWAFFVFMGITAGYFLGCSVNNKTSDSKVYVGISTPKVDSNYIKHFNKKFSYSPRFLAWHLDWEHPFPSNEAEIILKLGAIPFIFWEPWVLQDPDSLRLSHILDGDWDDYINAWAEKTRDYRFPVFISFAQNFNVQKNPWSTSKNGENPELYKKTFRYIVDLFREKEAFNVVWVWNYYNTSDPKHSWNEPEKAYPGVDYVDWVGISGVNNGNAFSWSNWETFEDLFLSDVRSISTIFKNKPIILTEFDTVGKGGDSKKWFSQIPIFLRSTLSQVQGLIFLEKGMDFVLSNNNDLGLRKLFQDEIFESNLELINSVTEQQPVSGISLDIPPITSEKVIDGKFDDWDGPYLKKLGGLDQIISGPVHWQGKDDLSGKLWIEWGNNRLLLRIYLVDDVPGKNNFRKRMIRYGDSVELGLSKLENTSQRMHIGIQVALKNAIIWDYVKGEILRHSSVIVRPLKNEEGVSGVALEADINLSQLAINPLKKGEKLIFRLKINDADESQRAETVLAISSYKLDGFLELQGTQIQMK